MTIRAFIFDMDGTMIDSMPYHRMALAQFARKHGVAMDLDEIMRRTTGRTGIESMSDIFERQLPLEVATSLIHEKEVIYRELFAPHLREVGGFKAFIRKAYEAGLACAVGTAGDAANVDFVFSYLFAGADASLAPQVVIRGDMGLAGKPAPDIFLRAARDLGVTPNECVVFEDAPLGIAAAKRAGMRAVALTTTNTALELAGDHVLATAPNYATLWTQLDSRVRGNDGN